MIVEIPRPLILARALRGTRIEYMAISSFCIHMYCWVSIDESLYYICDLGFSHAPLFLWQIFY